MAGGAGDCNFAKRREDRRSHLLFGCSYLVALIWLNAKKVLCMSIVFSIGVTQVCTAAQGAVESSATVAEQTVKRGIDGVLGTRGSIMLDVVFVAMFAVVPVLIYSVLLVKNRRKYLTHKRLQIALGSILIVAVSAFEIDMRFFTDWRQRAVASPYYRSEGWSPVMTSLVIHLSFAIPTLAIWIWTIVGALRRFESPPQPCRHSPAHRKLGWAATLGMIGTAATGWVFYWMAFVAA